MQLLCATSAFRYYEWVGIPGNGCAYELVHPGPATSIGIQIWGDDNDGLARVSVDGKIMWEGDTRGQDANWPGGAFVRYLAIDYLPLGAHTVRIETTDYASVTIYFIGTGAV